MDDGMDNLDLQSYSAVDPIQEEPKKSTSVYDRLYAGSKSKSRRRNDDEPPKKVEKPKKKPPKKERSFNVDYSDHKVASVSSSLQLEDEKPKQRLSVYERLYKTTTESRRAQQKNAIAEQIINDRKARQQEASEVQENGTEENKVEEQEIKEAEVGKVETGSPAKVESENEADYSQFDFSKIQRTRPKTAREIQKIIVKSVKNQGAFRRLTRVPVPLIERESMIQAAVPVLPKFLARTFLMMNVLVPGSGTISAGISNLCCGAPRFTLEPTSDHRLLAFVISFFVGVAQMVTVLFCLVGWCWSVGWGIIMITTADSYQRISKSQPRRPTIGPSVILTTDEPATDLR